MSSIGSAQGYQVINSSATNGRSFPEKTEKWARDEMMSLDISKWLL